MAFVIVQPMVFDLWNWGGSSGKVRVFASQSFYEATTGQFIPQGNVQTVSSACQVLDATVSGTDFTIPEITLATTIDSTVPNATFTVCLYDSSDVLQFTLISQAFIDVDYFQSPPLYSALVAGAGADATNGIYTNRGTENGRPYYNLEGEAGDPAISAISWSGDFWIIYAANGDILYFNPTPATYPWQVDGAYDVDISGTPPAPTVTEASSVVGATWEQITLSNQARATAGAPFQWNAPFWDVQQTKQYVNTVVGTSATSTPYASATVAGKTKLDTSPASSSSPIAIGVNSPTISTMQTDIAALQTGKAPKANPTFTGTLNAATIIASGNITGANLSGTNTGNVTKSGENYLTLTGQAITANAVNLSGTNVTGTLAAARMPALTGDVTTSAGAVATSIAANAVVTAKINDLAVTTAKINTSAVTDAKVATGIDAAKLADGTVSNTEFQYINSLSSNVQTQIDTKSPTISPAFTGVPTAPTAAPGTNTTQLATTAFVEAAIGGTTALVYRAVLSQSSTGAPTATVIENTLGGSVVWARSGMGTYTATLASAFTVNKTQIFLGNEWTPFGASDFAVLRTVKTSTSVVTLVSYLADPSGGTFASSDDVLAGTDILITVSP